MRKILLDTNAYSHLLRGDKKVLTVISEADIVLLSIFVLGELYAGFKGGSQEKANREILSKFLKKPTVQTFSATQETAQIFAEIKQNLKKAGTPIPINDVWISAHAFEMGAVLITYDAHFKKVAGLRIWDES